MWAPGCQRGSAPPSGGGQRQRDHVLVVGDDLTVGDDERDAAVDVGQRRHVADGAGQSEEPATTTSAKPSSRSWRDADRRRSAARPGTGRRSPSQVGGAGRGGARQVGHGLRRRPHLLRREARPEVRRRCWSRTASGTWAAARASSRACAAAASATSPCRRCGSVLTRYQAPRWKNVEHHDDGHRHRADAVEVAVVEVDARRRGPPCGARPLRCRASGTGRPSSGRRRGRPRRSSARSRRAPRCSARWRRSATAGRTGGSACAWDRWIVGRGQHLLEDVLDLVEDRLRRRRRGRPCTRAAPCRGRRRGWPPGR